MPVLEINKVSKAYNQDSGSKIQVLNNFSLTVSKNEFVSVIGPSGCGKSTLLDCIAGLTPVDSGEILLNGKVLNGKTGRIAYMMQDDVLLPWKTLSGNVSLPLELAGQNIIEIEKRIRDLSAVFGLSEYLKYNPNDLSGGMKQRASLMRAYVQNKDVILLDEPFGKLDALLKIKLGEWFLKIWQEKMLSVLMVTHDIDEAVFLSDTIYVMSPKSAGTDSIIKIPFKRPRKNDLLVSGEFTKLKKQLLKIFHL